MKIDVFGKASQSLITTLTPCEADLQMSLMDYLRGHNIPIASSCLGAGHCFKCCVNRNIRSCQITVEDALHIGREKADQALIKVTITIDYL